MKAAAITAPHQGARDVRPSALKPLTSAEIRRLRRRLGLSQQRFGELVLVDRVTVWRWEHSRVNTLRIPQASTLFMRKLEAQLDGRGDR